MKTKTNKIVAVTIVLFIVVSGISLMGQNKFFPRKWNTRKVNIAFNRYYDWAEMEAALRKLQKAYPKFLTLKSIGKSFQGRNIWYMTINNPDTGKEMNKAAMYMDANIHGNEVQGGEVCLYTIWYLMENYKYNDYIRQLVDERVFYLFPSVNPDGRDLWLHKGGSARSSQTPYDNDNDGLYDEDGPEDLDGDGEVGSMYIKVPLGEGTHRLNDTKDRLVPVKKNIKGKADELGDYKYIGSEGLDNDGDGRYNEDGGGGYDPNRDWASHWQPNYIQRGAGEYPFYWPESKLIKDFFYAHTNIAGVQAFHNSGGMILRGPGVNLHGEYKRADLSVYDEIGRKGEKIIEGYKYMILWKDLYPVWGGFIDFTHDMLGIYSFSNELWTSRSDLNRDKRETPEEREFFDKHINMDNKAVGLHQINHPQLGKVWIDRDTTKLSGRVPPTWLLEELCHRNMAFCLLHAHEMPMPRIKQVRIKPVAGKLKRLYITLYNERLMPTMSATAIENRVQRPDTLSIEGNVRVLAAGYKQSMNLSGVPARFRRFIRRFRGASSMSLVDEKDLKKIKIHSGIPGKSELEYEILVEGKGPVTLKLDCQKGGVDTKTVTLK